MKFTQMEIGDDMLLETKNHNLTCVGEVLKGFYKEMEWDSKPLAISLNPEVRGTPVYKEHTYYILYRSRNRYHVTVTTNYSQVSGPHIAKLFYRSQQTMQMFWIATLQITDTMFFNQDKIIDALAYAIATEAFYASDKSKKDLITL